MAHANRQLLFDEFLGPLEMHLKLGDVTYRGYLSQGRTFLYARILRRNNLAIRSLVMSKGYLLPLDLQAHAIALVAHLNVWLELWDDTQRTLDPVLDDAFVFHNSVTFPQESVAVLRALYRDHATNLENIDAQQ